MIIYFDYRIVESFERVTSQYAQHIPLNATVNFTNPSVSITAENVSINGVHPCSNAGYYVKNRCQPRFFNKKGEIWHLVSYAL